MVAVRKGCDHLKPATVGSRIPAAMGSSPATVESLRRRLESIERRVELLARTFGDVDLGRLLARVRDHLAAAVLALQQSSLASMAQAAAALEEAESSLNTLGSGPVGRHTARN
jgi:hypothetical protein